MASYKRQEKPKKVPTDIDWAWAAGFLEGEGCFSPESGTDKRARMSANQKQREPLEKLLECFGGRIYAYKKRDLYLWMLRGKPARPVMETLLPMMSTRRQEQIKKSLAAKFSIEHGSKERLAQVGSYMGFFGKKHSSESKAKMSVARKAYWATKSLEWYGG